jgi:hypothetical protein
LSGSCASGSPGSGTNTSGMGSSSSGNSASGSGSAGVFTFVRVHAPAHASSSGKLVRSDRAGSPALSGGGTAFLTRPGCSEPQDGATEGSSGAAPSPGRASRAAAASPCGCWACFVSNLPPRF